MNCFARQLRRPLLEVSLLVRLECRFHRIRSIALGCNPVGAHRAPQSRHAPAAPTAAGGANCCSFHTVPSFSIDHVTRTKAGMASLRGEFASLSSRIKRCRHPARCKRSTCGEVSVMPAGSVLLLANECNVFRQRFRATFEGYAHRAFLCGCDRRKN